MVGDPAGRQAVAGSDVLLVLLPDEVIPEVFAADIAPHLAAGSAIVFASGYTLAYGLIQPPSGIDVLLLAPRMAGENARQRLGQGVRVGPAVPGDVAAVVDPALTGRPRYPQVSSAEK
jgi:ketol-acid reductoisomerase